MAGLKKIVRFRGIRYNQLAASLCRGSIAVLMQVNLPGLQRPK